MSGPGKTTFTVTPPSADAPDSVEQERLPLVTTFGSTLVARREGDVLLQVQVLPGELSVRPSSYRGGKEFLDRVYDFQKTPVEDWAKALDLEMPQVDSSRTSGGVLRELFAKRTAKIRRDLEEFVRGTKGRMDIEGS
jgi:hypothetical protein